MGSQCNPNKPHYDITMSKRTRKALNLQKETNCCPLKSCFSERENPPKGANEEEEDDSFTRVGEKQENDHEKEAKQSPLKKSFGERKSPLKVVNGEKEEEKSFTTVDEGQESDHKSLKELIEGRSSLGQHFTEEEKQLQLVVKHHERGFNGVKFKKMVSRYAKVLSRLIKIKRDPRLGSQKKPVLRLTT